jgi:hypothetical protein
MTLSEKFKKHMAILQDTVDGRYVLDMQNPKLYKKVCKYLSENGLEFSGDPYDDYEMFLDQLALELNVEETVEK